MDKGFNNILRYIIDSIKTMAEKLKKIKPNK